MKSAGSRKNMCQAKYRHTTAQGMPFAKPNGTRCAGRYAPCLFAPEIRGREDKERKLEKGYFDEQIKTNENLF